MRSIGRFAKPDHGGITTGSRRLTTSERLTFPKLDSVFSESTQRPLFSASLIGKTLDGRVLQAQIEWDRGYRELSLMLLRGLRQDFASSERVYARLQQALRVENQNVESRRLSILHQIKHPNRSRSHLDRIRSLTAGGDASAATLAARQMIDTFSLNPSALLELGDFAANTSNVTLAQTLKRHFQQHGLPAESIMQLLLIEALLNAERYQEVLNEVTRIQQSSPIGDQITNTAKGLAAIAYYGLGDTRAGTTNLTAFMAQPQLRPESLLAIADRLANMGNREAAKITLAQALHLFPQSQPILTKLLELNLKDRDPAEISGRLKLLMGMRKPSPVILADALEWLNSDQFLFLDDRATLIGKIEQHFSQN